MADVFISYSRKDKDFVQVLHQALTNSQYETWVDWEGIPLTADWWEEIKAGIDAADTFIFVISPDSIASKVCGEEIDHAVANHKRLMPIVRRNGFDMAQVRPALGRHNWLFFQETDHFETAFQSLITALNTDLDHVKTHTRLLVRAREWETKDRDEDYLLRGSDLEEAEEWLAKYSNQQPYPADLHQAYISSSRKAELRRLQQERQRLRLFLSAIAGLALAILALAGVALMKRHEAIVQRERAYEQAKIAFAHQLVAEAEDPTQRALASLQQFKHQGNEADVAFGLATLDPKKVKALAAVQAQRIALSRSKQFLAVLGRDRTLNVWNLATEQVVLKTQAPSPLVDLDFSPDDQLLTAATQSGELRIWRVKATKYDLIAVLPGHGSALTDSAFSPSGRYLVTASSSGMAKIWDLAQMTNLKAVNALQPIAIVRHQGPINSVVVSPDEQSVITASQDRTMRIWSLNGQQQLCISHADPVRMVDYNDSNTYLGSVSGNSQVRIWSWPHLLQGPPQDAGAKSQC